MAKSKDILDVLGGKFSEAQGMSAAEIADHFEVAPSTVTAWINQKLKEGVQIEVGYKKRISLDKKKIRTPVYYLKGGFKK